MNQDILKLILGQGGSLVLCCVFLYWIMNQYQLLINQMITEHSKDRQTYQETMLDLSKHMDTVSTSLAQIQLDLQTIKANQK